MDLLIFTVIVLSGLALVIFLLKNNLSFSRGSLIYYATLTSWIFLAGLGAEERLNSINFKTYFFSQIDENYKGAVINAWETTSFQIILTLLISIFLFFVYSYFLYLHKRVKKINFFNKIFYLLVASLMMFYSFNAISKISDLKSYGFFISLLANVNFVLATCLFLLLTLKILKKKVE